MRPPLPEDDAGFHCLGWARGPWKLRCSSLFALSILFLSVAGVNDSPNRVLVASEPPARARLAHARLPLSFEPNSGQADPRVQFLSRGHGYTLFLTKDEAVLALKEAELGIKKQEARRSEIEVRNPKIEIRKSKSEKRKTTSAPGASTFLRMKLLGANPATKVTGEGELPGKANYFIGNNPKKWLRGVPTYGRVRYAGVYPGIDLVYYGEQQQLEFDFEVAPRADPSGIVLDVAVGLARAGGRPRGLPLRIAANGNLVVPAEGGEIQFQKPQVYQMVNGHRHAVAGEFALKGKKAVGFRLGNYDRAKQLVIDPVLSYSTYLGGSDMDYANGIAVDASGNAYITGYTASVDFPLVNPAQGSPGGGTCSEDGTDTTACFDAFVAKLNSTGTALVYSTYLGGSDEDYGASIALDASGHAYVTGYTYSKDFPVQSALQPNNAGGWDAFVTELSADGASLVYSTYWGGSLDDIATGIALDSNGNAYLSGYTDSTDFPATTAAFQTTYGGGAHNGFVVQFNAKGAQIGYSTLLGGGSDDYAYAVAVDSIGDAYVTGATNSASFPTLNAFQPHYAGGTCATAPNTFPCYDAFAAKLNPAGSALIFSTYLGGTGSDYGYAIALDSAANAYITGYTTSTNFPTTPGAFERAYGGSYDVFVAKLNGAGSTLGYSTYLGGSGTQVAYGIAVDSNGSAYITGYNYGGNFPTAHPVQAQNAGFYDAFVSVLDPTGSSLRFSTYLGGSQDDFGRGIALDGSGNVYVAGATFSPDFPTTSGSFQPAYMGGPYDDFVTEISAPVMPLVSLLPPSFDFGSVVVGTTSPPETIALADNGNGALTISSITASGDFSQTNTCGSSLATNASCSITVTFTPTAMGSRSGSITITDNASPATQTVSLLGTGTAPLVSLSPTSLAFPSVAVDARSSPQSVALSNTGNATLMITSIAASGDFSQTNTCGSSVGAGASCTISVTFKPTASGTRTGTVTIADNANPGAQTVSLTGTGVIAPIVSLSPASLTFSPQPLGTGSSARTVTLKNTGKATLSISSIKPTGDFSQTNTCGSSVKAGASCTLEVAFKPTAVGTRTGAVTLSDNASPATQAVNLTGTGTGPLVTLSPTSLTFPTQKVGTTSSAQSVKVENTGNATLRITSLKASSNFSQNNNCGSSVAAGASCTISVTFTPKISGTITGAVTLIDNARPATQTVGLTGSGGAATTVKFSPSSLTFAPQTVGTTSNAQVVTLANSGNATLSIVSINASGDSSQANNCGSSVPPNASCTLRVTFNPSAGGARTGAVTITDSAEGSPQSVTLTGTGEDFVLAAPPGSPASDTVSPGGTATYALSVAGVGGFNQNATFSCTGAPSETTCLISPASLTLSGAAANVTITVATTAPSLSLPRHNPISHFRPPPPWPWLPWIMALLASTVGGWAKGGRLHPGTRRTPAVLAIFAALLLLTLAVAACGGGGGGAAPPASNPGTPQGTYRLTATGVCSSCSPNLSHSVSLILQVQ